MRREREEDRSQFPHQAGHHQWEWHVTVYIIVGAIVSTIVMMGLTRLLISWDMAPVTAPFVLTAWLLLFAVYHFGQLHPTNLIGPMPVQPVAVIQTDLEEAAGIGAVGFTTANLANALFRGVGEVFLRAGSCCSTGGRRSTR